MPEQNSNTFKNKKCDFPTKRKQQLPNIRLNIPVKKQDTIKEF